MSRFSGKVGAGRYKGAHGNTKGVVYAYREACKSYIADRVTIPERTRQYRRDHPEEYAAWWAEHKSEYIEEETCSSPAVSVPW